MKQIRKIKVVREIDERPETSWIGTYVRKWVPGAIDRARFSCRWRRGQFPYFLPATEWWNLKGAEKREAWKHALEDMELLESLGETWDLIGIRAEAEIVVNTVLQQIGSGGLWGIESNSDDSYLGMVEAEELDNLVMILKELGFTESEIGKVEVVR